MIRIRTLLPVAAALFAVPALGQQQASTLAELLQEVADVRTDENAAFEKNRAEYDGTAEAQKAALLQRAEQQRAQLDAASKRLSDTYAANEQ